MQQKSMLIQFLVLVLFASAMMAVAEVPGLMNYQGRLTNPAGDALDTSISMTFTIYDDSTGGNPIWTETHSEVEVSNGLFHVILGSAGAKYPFDVTISDGEYYLDVTVGGDPPIEPRTRLTSAPYAFHSRSVENFHPGPNNVDSGQYNLVAGECDTIIASYSTIGGGFGNIVKSFYDADTTIPEENPSINRAGGAVYITLCGGLSNIIYGHFGSIGGGVASRIGSGPTATFRDGRLSTIGGGYRNIIAGDCSDLSVIGGGHGNRIEAGYATIAGGARTSFYDANTGNTVYDIFGSIGGGGNNKAGTDYGGCTDAPFTTISGGKSNTASGSYSSIGGGQSNTASGNWASIGGGYSHYVPGDHSTVAGGQGNTADGSEAAVGGGYENFATGDTSVVSGGASNVALGECAMIPGGTLNRADGHHSFAAGRLAEARDDGCFVWADRSVYSVFNSTLPNQFLIRADGGVGIGVMDPTESLDLYDKIRIRGGSPALNEVLTCIDAIGTAEWLPAVGGTDADWDIGTTPGHMFSMPAGNVGIGISIPTSKLHVNDAISVSNDAAVEVNFNNAVGSIGAIGIYVDPTALPSNGTQICVSSNASMNASGQSGSADGRLARVTSWEAYGAMIGVEGTADISGLDNDPGPNSWGVGGKFVGRSTTGINITDPDGAYYVGGVYGEVRDQIDATVSNAVVAGVIGIDNNSGSALSYAAFFDAVMHLVPLANAPTTAQEGDIYYDGTLHKLMVHNGTTWIACF